MTTLTRVLPSRPLHPTGVWSWITTVDHKRIGILYGVTAFIMFISGGLEAMYMRLQLAQPGQDFVAPGGERGGHGGLINVGDKAHRRARHRA